MCKAARRIKNSIFRIIIPNSSNVAYTNKKKQILFQAGDSIIDYDNEREVPAKVRTFLSNESPPPTFSISNADVIFAS